MSARSKKPLIFLWVGFGCLSLGLGSAHIGQRFSVLSALPALLGAVALLLFCVKVAGQRNKQLKTAQWKRPALMAAAVAASVILLVLINFLAYSLPWRWDLTKAKQHTLLKSTTDIVRELKQDVQLTAFYVGIPPKYLSDLFQEFERRSQGRIKTEIIDPIVRIGYAAQFGSVISGKVSKVIVRSGGADGTRRDVDFTKKPLSEEQLINAIIRVTRKERTLYFLTGHSEYDILNKKTGGLSRLAELLSENNILSKRLMLGIKGKIPADCDVLVIAGPQTPLTKKEEGLIRKYLKKGGDALFLIEHVIVTTPDKPLTRQEKLRNPSLNGILRDWGLKIGDDVVVDLSNHVGSDVGIPATRNYASHEALTKGLDYTFYVRPRSISVLENRRKSIKLAPVVLTASKEASWGETDRTLQIKFDPSTDVPGPVPIAYVVFEPKEKDKSSDTRMIVFTDADFLTNAFIGQYSNAKLGLNVLNWLSEADYLVFMGTKEVAVARLDLTSKQKRMVAVVLLLIPLLIAVSGITFWVRQTA